MGLLSISYKHLSIYMYHFKGRIAESSQETAGGHVDFLIMLLTLSSLQVPIGNCLFQCHRRQSATCRQNATVAVQRLEGEEWLSLLNLLCWKPKLVLMIVTWQGGFPPNTWHVFVLRCFESFFSSDFWSSSVCHQWQLMQCEVSYAFLKLFAI